MAGIGSILNIAKNALLTHQLSVQVASHNVANVDTPGYTRQALNLTTNFPETANNGIFGGGVAVETIMRQYDQFFIKKNIDQQSLLGNLNAQLQSMQIVESVLNEASGQGLNNLLSKFWSSWQDLANNPELLASRGSVIQTGELLVDYLHTTNTQLVQAKADLGLNLNTAVDDVNLYSQQIADLNVQISSTEGGKRRANDLRDSRDELLSKLSELIDINYFENDTGAYSVFLAKGNPLVDGNSSWKVEWAGDTLYWISKSNNDIEMKSSIGEEAGLGGKIGGWLEVRNMLIDGDTTNYKGQLDALTNALIREINWQHSQGVGFSPFSEAVWSTETADDVARLTTAVDASTSTKTIAADSIVINGRKVGRIAGAGAANGLAMIKAANAVQAINEANTGVTARLTTLMAGDPITAGLNAGQSVSFTVNGVAINYTAPAPNLTPVETAQEIVDTANAAFTGAGLTIKAVVGDGANGGAVNSIVFRNTNAGDESRIVIADIDVADPAEAKIGLANGTYISDETHNTGEITLFSRATFTIQAGVDDFNLDQLGMGGGGIGENDGPDDGQFTYTASQGEVTNSIQGLRYVDELDTDNGRLNIWIYNQDGTPALAQPVEISLERAYRLDDVTTAINDALVAAGAVDGTTGNPWLTASIEQNRLVLTPDSNHSFAFGNDTSNILQVTGINTFFKGYDAATIGVNEGLLEDPNRIAAATINDHGEIFRGDNSNALLITNLQREENITFQGGSTGSFDGFYNSLIATIGFSTKGLIDAFDFNTIVANQMQELRDNVSGVSLDEEMANIIKYQQSYSAAAKLVSISDEMLRTVLATIS